ncbi:MAG: MFS transporter [Planctomycetes bacterium]|nr:MFS transporter [Planctomycetota bacterium]
MSDTEAVISIDSPKRRRGLFFVGAAVVGVGFAIAIQVGCNDNFVVEELGLGGDQKGILEAVRESCGVVALGLLALLAGFAEPLVGAGMVALFGVGLASYYFVPTFGWLLATSLVWSQGLHVWMPLPDSMTMSLAEPGRVGFRLGQMRAAGSAGFGAGMAAALLLTLAGVALRPLFLLSGAVGLLAAAACLGIPRGLKTPGPRLVLRRRYGLYYALCFLDGWRRQIFLCFAGFLLVKVYKTPVQTILLLYVAVQVIGYLGFPWLGRLIDRVGERRVLVVYFACVTAVFVGYALVRVRGVLFGLFLADSILSGCATAIVTYVHRIAPPSEHTATLGMGVAMNHVAAVTMPLLGGVLWQQLGYEWVFAAGIAAAAASILVALRVPPK